MTYQKRCALKPRPSMRKRIKKGDSNGGLVYASVFGLGAGGVRTEHALSATSEEDPWGYV